MTAHDSAAAYVAAMLATEPHHDDEHLSGIYAQLVLDEDPETVCVTVGALAGIAIGALRECYPNEHEYLNRVAELTDIIIRNQP